MSYQPIENYGMIGDMHTVALVGPGMRTLPQSRARAPSRGSGAPMASAAMSLLGRRCDPGWWPVS